MVRSIDERLLDDAAVLDGRTPEGAPPLSAFESAVLAAVDGIRDNRAIASSMGLSTGDLRIALTGLLAHGWLDGIAVRPALSMPPRTPAPLPRTSTPLSRPAVLPRTPTPLTTLTAAMTTGAVATVHDDRNGAAALQALAIRELRLGHFKNARTVAEQAAAAAPSVAQHRETLATWDVVVGKNLGASLTKPAERIECCRAWIAANPRSGHAWGRLAEVLADKDVVEASKAAATATKLEPESAALRELAAKLEDEARQASRRQKFRAFFTLTPSTAAKK